MQLFIRDDSGARAKYRRASPAAIIEAARSAAVAPLIGKVLSDPGQAREALRDALTIGLGTLEHEAFAVAFLTTRHQLIALDILFRGSIDCAAVYPREVVKAALAHNAAAVILIHNHPSGDATPSVADQRLTTRLRDALATVEIRTLDHLVVGVGEIVSFAERGLI